MKQTVTSISPTSSQLSVVLEKDELQTAKQDTVKRLGKNVKIAGFRPGKAPINVIEKNLDQNVLHSQVLEDAINRFYIAAAIEAKLQPIDRPEVEVTKFVPNETLEFTATVEVMPEVKLGDYKKIKKQLTTEKVTAKDVTEVIDRLRASSAKKEEVERPAKLKDEVVIDFSGKDAKGEVVPGATGKEYSLTLGSKTFIPGFEEELVGLKIGEEKEFTVTFPEDYGHKPLANQKVTFTVKIHKILEPQLPAADDEFAKGVGPFETFEDLKKDIKTELQRQKEYDASNKLKNEILDELVEKSKMELPKSLVADQEKAVRQDLIQNLAYRGVTLEQALEEQKITDEEWTKKEVTPQAERRVKVGMVLSEVAKAEKIQVPEAEVQERIAEMKEQYQNPEVRTQLDTQEAYADISSRIKTEKTINRLFELATAA